MALAEIKAPDIAGFSDVPVIEVPRRNLVAIAARVRVTSRLDIAPVRRPQ
jgi:hypothetical protein